MKSSLDTLTRIQKFNIDEQRKKLVEQLEKEEKIIQAIKDLIAAYEAEKVFTREHPNIGDFGLYTKCYLQKRDDLEVSLVAVRRKVAEIRDIIADMFKKQKTYEIVDEHRKVAAEKEIDAKEQKMLDEIGTNTYIKRNKK